MATVCSCHGIITGSLSAKFSLRARYTNYTCVKYMMIFTHLTLPLLLGCSHISTSYLSLECVLTLPTLLWLASTFLWEHSTMYSILVTVCGYTITLYIYSVQCIHYTITLYNVYNVHTSYIWIWLYILQNTYYRIYCTLYNSSVKCILDFKNEAINKVDP